MMDEENDYTVEMESKWRKLLNIPDDADLSEYPDWREYLMENNRRRFDAVKVYRLLK